MNTETTAMINGIPGNFLASAKTFSERKSGGTVGNRCMHGHIDKCQTFYTNELATFLA